MNFIFMQLRCAVNNEDMPIANFSVKHGILQVPTNLIFGPDTLLEFSIVGAQVSVILMNSKYFYLLSEFLLNVSMNF